MSEIRFEGVEKRYDDADSVALAALNLRVGSGQFVVLVGPSGCGKSTTLRLLAGLETPTAGNIFIGDQNVTQVAPAKRDIAMVFQNYALYPHLTVFENLAFALKLRKMPQAEIQKLVAEVAEMLEISDYLQRKPKQLSGGQRQRVAMGRALVRKPKVFLFDEPLSNLDAKLRGDMRREIAKLHQTTRTTTVYVTHDQLEAMTLADTIVVMKKGYVQQVGSPLDVYQKPANLFVAGFFGTPTMNFARGEIADNKVQLSGLSIPLAPGVTPKGQNVTVGIRPEFLRIGPSQNGEPSVQGTVELVERLGNENLVHVKSAVGTWVIRSNEVVSFADIVQISISPEHLHFFDADETRMPIQQGN